MTSADGHRYAYCQEHQQKDNHKYLETADQFGFLAANAVYSLGRSSHYSHTHSYEYTQH